MMSLQRKYLALERSKESLSAKFTFLRESGIEWYEGEALRIYERDSFPRCSDENLANLIFPKSPNELAKRRDEAQYYVANSIAFARVLREILSDGFISRFGEDKEDALVVANYYRLMQGLLFDSLHLLNEYVLNVKRGTAPFGLGKNPLQHTFTLYQSIRQMIYGQASYHSFTDLEPDLAAAHIRVLIELRIRRAFGVLGYIDASNDTLTPLPLSRILGVLEPFKNQIDFSVPFATLTRIYGWANVFTHIGLKDYLWKHIFAMHLLAEFACGKRNSRSDSFSVASGIGLTEAVLLEVKQGVKDCIPAGSDLLECPPEANVAH